MRIERPMDVLMEKTVQTEKQKTGFRDWLAKSDGFVAGHKWPVILFCAAIMVLITALKYTLYHETGFTDAYNIMLAANSGDCSGGDSAFVLTASMAHAVVSVFGPLSMRAWGWLLLVPGFFMFAVIAAKAPAQNLASALVLMAFSVFLPYFVFMPCVDFIQYTVFFLMALILLYVPGQIWKLICGELLLLPVILLFRDYYALMAFLAAVMYLFALLYRKPKTIGQQTVFLIAFAILCVVSLLLLRLIAPETANELFLIRTETNMGFEHTPAPDKVIMDLLPMDTSVAGFLVNYLAAAVRILVPAELCADFMDIPFVVFQILLDILILMELIKSRRVKARTAVYSFIIAFFLMSFVFEPGFGSWFKHEAAAFPLLWLGIGHDRLTAEGGSDA